MLRSFDSRRKYSRGAFYFYWPNSLDTKQKGKFNYKRTRIRVKKSELIYSEK